MTTPRALQRQVLLVEPDGRFRSILASVIASLATVHAHGCFKTARGGLLAAPAPDLIVTNLRLEAYNGLHLAHVARQFRLSTRIVVYGGDQDLEIARGIRCAGTFFELAERLPVAIRGYFTASLPATERRDPARYDRRALPRGGRRLWDLHQVAAIQL